MSVFYGVDYFVMVITYGLVGAVSLSCVSAWHPITPGCPMAGMDDESERAFEGLPCQYGVHSTVPVPGL